MSRPLSAGALLAAAGLVVWLPILPHARIVRDDWGNLYTLGQLFREGALSAFWSVLSNAWVKAPRVFWTSWEVQGALVPVFGFVDLPYYLLAFLAHGATAWLLYRALRELTGDELCAALAAGLGLLQPAATTGVLFLNNWFFVLPCLFLAAALRRLARPERGPGDLAALCALAVLGQFAGEMTLPAFYALFALALVRTCWLEKRPPSHPSARRAWLPLLACAIALLVYLPLFVRPYAQGLTPSPSLASVLVYLQKLSRLILVSQVPISRFYGQLSIPPSAGTIAASLALAAAAAAFAKRAVPTEPDPARLRLAAALLAALGAACLVPLLYGAATGYRPIPETRYLYPLGALLAPAAGLLAASLLPSRARVPALAAALWLLGTFTLYQGRDVWGAQKAFDERLWRAIESALDAEVKNIVVDGQEHEHLTPPFHSDAVSDFHAPYGISMRLLAKKGVDLRVGCGLLDSAKRGVAEIKACYGAGSWSAPESSVLAISLRHGPRFSDFARAEPRLFRRLEDYRRWKRGA